MERSDVDADQMVAVLRRRVLDAEERVTAVQPTGGPQALVKTDRRTLHAFRPSWRLLSESWVTDAVIVVWLGSALSHTEEQIFGLVFDRDGREYLLAWGDDDLPQLGRRLAIDRDHGGLDPEAFAEALAMFHTAPYMSGHLIDDPALLAERFPGAEVPRLHPVSCRRDNGSVILEFQAYQLYPDHGAGTLVVREWRVVASTDQPATWTNHEIAQVSLH